MSKLGLSVNSIKPVLCWQKAVQKPCMCLQKSFVAPTGYRFMPKLACDIVSFSNQKNPNEIFSEISSLGISKLRRLDTKTYSGETLENRPEILNKLRSYGIKTVVDFRSEAGNNYKKECENAGLEYFQFPLSHTKSFSQDVEINDEFVCKLKKLFEVFNRGDAYLGCKWGIDRTNLGLMLNYLLNPTEHIAPEIIAWGGDSEKTIVNKSKKVADNILKKLTPEHKKTLEMGVNCRETSRHRATRLLNKYKSTW